MQYKKLAFTDLEVSRVGFGGWAIGGHGWGRVDNRESIAAVRRALERGVNLFDTADVYGFGHSEVILAEALGELRKHVVIATKFGVKWDDQGRISRDVSPGHLTEALENSLRRLKIDCIPLYQIHWPDGRTPIALTMETLKRCQEAGKIRWIGCCNFPSDLLREAREIGPVVSLQVPYNIFDRDVERRTLGDCRELGVGVLAYSPLAQGLLSGKHGPGARFEEEDIRSRSVYFQGPKYLQRLEIISPLEAIGTAYGKSAAQVAIRWVLDNTEITCALTGIKSVRQVDENVETDWILSVEDRQLIDAISRPLASNNK